MMRPGNGKILFTSMTILSLAFLGACSSKPKEACPSVAEEAISVCRARQKCESEKSGTGVGVGLGFGAFGLGVGRGVSADRYTDCVDRDLKAQEAASKSDLSPRQ